MTLKFLRKILTDILRTLINNPFNESFYKEKKSINVLIVFFISYKSNVKTFLK